MRLSRRDLRLASGLVLFGYVALHLLNHALGLVSVAVAERGLELAVTLWHSLPGTVLLYGAPPASISHSPSSRFTAAARCAWRRST
jgi:adenylate cyclase